MNKKPKKRKNPDIPVKSVLRRYADRLWSLAVRTDCNYQCVVCRKHYDALHAHHLVPRMYAATRYDVWNGVGLCFWDHTKNTKLAPHQNPAGFMAWLSTNMPARAAWYVENRDPGVVTKDEAYYVAAIRDLKQYIEPLEFEQIVGIRFSQWLEESAEIHLDEQDAE